MAKQDPRDIAADALAALASGHDPAADEAEELRAESHAPAAMRSNRPALPNDILPPVAQTMPDPDDEVLAPAPDPSVLGRIRHAPHHAPRRFSLEGKRTLIPILLTCGVLCLVSAALKYLMGPDSPFAQLPIGIVIGAAALGLILLGSAAAMMLGVRAAMAAQGATHDRR